MAKTIKFNLSCDGHPVRTLEDLREHFSMEDVLEYLNNGMLARWLDIQGYTAEKEQVEQITADNDRDRLWALVNIFDIDADQKEVTERAQQLDWKNRQKALSAAYQASGESRRQILDDYFAGYENAVKTILENPDDYGIIQAAVADIDEHYRAIFDKGYMQLLLDIHEVSPLGAFTLLTRLHMREVYRGMPKDIIKIPTDYRTGKKADSEMGRTNEKPIWEKASIALCRRYRKPFEPIKVAKKAVEKNGKFIILAVDLGPSELIMFSTPIFSHRYDFHSISDDKVYTGEKIFTKFPIFQGIEFEGDYDVYYMQI